jgi:hypothetical protein
LPHLEDADATISADDDLFLRQASFHLALGQAMGSANYDLLLVLSVQNFRFRGPKERRSSSGPKERRSSSGPKERRSSSRPKERRSSSRPKERRCPVAAP